MSDAEELKAYIDIWWQSIDDLTALLESLTPDEWMRPTDLAGWNVHAIAAHIAHLEALLAGAPGDDGVDIGEPAHVKSPMGTFTEQGVVARRDRTPDELIAEIRESATKRHTEHLAAPPTDADAPAPGVFGLIGWSWRTLLRNRPLDVWMHEQDIRRATARPGNLDSPAARHVTNYLAGSIGVIVGKRVAPPAGTVVRLAIEGSAPVAVRVNEEGRAERVDAVSKATTAISLSREEFTTLAGGRRTLDQVRAAGHAVAIEGDAALGEQVLAQLAVTP